MALLGDPVDGERRAEGFFLGTIRASQIEADDVQRRAPVAALRRLSSSRRGVSGPLRGFGSLKIAYSTRIIKGGALLEESRRFVESWDDELTAQTNLEQFLTHNLLGKKSRARAEDTIAILRQRFVDPGPEIMRALRPLTIRADGFRDACYFETARNDELLAYTAQALRRLRDRGGSMIRVGDLERELLERPPVETIRAWGQSTRTRVIHGLLSTLRDFGVLEGRANKRIAPSHITFSGFVYVLGRLRQLTSSSHALVTSNAWGWWLLDDSQVRSQLLEADREGVLRYRDAGSAIRIDWRIDGLEELVRAVA